MAAAGGGETVFDEQGQEPSDDIAGELVGLCVGASRSVSA